MRTCICNQLAHCAVRAQGLDIGPKSIDLIQKALGDCKTVIWNGPMGVFEFEKFAKGTFAIADTLANMGDCITIIGESRAA